VVEEIPLYDACGEGEHVYVRLTREGWTTREVKLGLAELFGLREVDVGCAGMKDKHARATQTFSLLLLDIDEETMARRIEGELPVEVEWVCRHRNKLRAGHLLGNRFRVVVLHPEPGAVPRAAAIAQALQEQGLPNFYGVQRFGFGGDNAVRGRQVLFGSGPRKRWLRRFLLRAYQSALFNAWLVERMQLGWFQQILVGDIAKKTDTGGLFEVEDASVDGPRFQRGEITYTGPIYGYRMLWANGRPGEMERMLLDEEGVTQGLLKRARLDGSRRPARLLVDDLKIESHLDELLFTFTLPKGAYATTLLREFMKTETEFEHNDVC
jgi:tRNA pseudouridine13 synthase